MLKQKLPILQIVKSVYAFEFLGLKHQDAVEESDLEAALLENLQDLCSKWGMAFVWKHAKKRS
jgi:predicted nuclease of restriction endonuclease-like (RecB) superfamily